MAKKRNTKKRAWSPIFSARNTTEAPVHITEITTSCGCTTAEIDEITIPTGESRQLIVHFDPDFHKEPEGKFSRTVFLQTAKGLELQAKIEVEISE